jgi:cytochrome c-type biogenesis protein CcmH
MVCQNQSIDDSDAPLARDLRLLVRERLKAGDSDAQVLDFLTARYGQFVLLKPRFGWDTALLWGAPAGVLLVGGLAIVLALRRRKDLSAPVTTPLTDDETRRLEELTRR